MACTPFAPAPGIFFNAVPFQTGTSGQWSFQRTGDIVNLRRSGATVDSVSVPAGSTANWRWFSTNNFVAVRAASPSAVGTTFRLWIFDLRNPAAVTHYEVSVGLGTATQLVVDHSSDGLAFFAYLWTSADTTTAHGVYRSDNGDELCGAGPATYAATQRLAEIVVGKIWIYASPGPLLPAPHPGSGGGYLIATCDLPSGNCLIDHDQSSPLNFGEVVVGGPASLATRTRTARITNDGDDCLDIMSVASLAPFTANPPSPGYPRTLLPGQFLDVNVTFAPGAVGSFGPIDLIVTRNPARGDDRIRCVGTARAPVRRIAFSPTSVAFGTLAVGSGGRTLPLTVSNTGELPLTVSAAASTGPGYSSAVVPPTIIPIPGTVPSGAVTIQITFDPPGEGSFPGSLTITSDAPGSPHVISLGGSGCVPNTVMVAPAAPLPSFGNVEQGFRAVRAFTVRNSGDAVLHCRARLQGLDASLYSLQLPGQPITGSTSTLPFDVIPTSLCGGGPGGTGEATIGIVFWANDAPRMTQASLILEELNGTTVVSTLTYQLEATITPPVPIDTSLVIDRSGSMAGAKITAAMAAGRLFVQLLRPDVADRVTIVKYNTTPEVVQPILPVTSATPPTQQDIANTITPAAFTAAGATSIAGGVMLARTELDTARPAPLPPAGRRSMVVLTDGIDNRAYQRPADGLWYSLRGGASTKPDGSSVNTVAVPSLATILLYAVGIGTAEQVDVGQLSRLSQATGGDYLPITDVAGLQYFELEKYFTQIYMNIVDLATISDPVYDSLPGQVHRSEFDLLRGDVSAMVVIYDRPSIRLPVRIISPVGEIIDMSVAPAGFQLRTGEAPTARFIEFRVPAGEENRYAGRWAVEVAHPSGAIVYSHVAPEAGATRFGIAIGAGSNFRMQPYLTPGPVRIGDPILLSAIVSEAGLRMPGCTVTVHAVSPSGAAWDFTLRDDGAHQDGDAGDGEYAIPFGYTNEGGSYTFAFRTVGLTRDGKPVAREGVLGKYVEGRLPVEPTPSSDDRCCSAMLRLLRIGLIVLIAILVVAVWLILSQR